MSLPPRFGLPEGLKSLRNYVDGRFVETDKRFDNISPLDGRILGSVHEADAQLWTRRCGRHARLCKGHGAG